MNWYIINNFLYGDFQIAFEIINCLGNGHQIFIRDEGWRYTNGEIPVIYKELFTSENLCISSHSRSFKKLLFNRNNVAFEGLMYDWYKVNSDATLYRLIENDFLFNIAIAQDKKHLDNPLYYLNLVENNSIFLAIQTERNDLPLQLKHVTEPKYEIVQYKEDMRL